MRMTYPYHVRFTCDAKTYAEPTLSVYKCMLADAMLSKAFYFFFVHSFILSFAALHQRSRVCVFYMCVVFLLVCAPFVLCLVLITIFNGQHTLYASTTNVHHMHYIFVLFVFEIGWIFVFGEVKRDDLFTSPSYSHLSPHSRIRIDTWFCCAKRFRWISGTFDAFFCCSSFCWRNVCFDERCVKDKPHAYRFRLLPFSGVHHSGVAEQHQKQQSNVDWNSFRQSEHSGI